MKGFYCMLTFQMRFAFNKACFEGQLYIDGGIKREVSVRIYKA